VRTAGESRIMDLCNGYLAHPFVKMPALPLSIVENADISPTHLTALSTRLMLASPGVLPFPDLKERGFKCPLMCSCSCSWSAFFSVWYCFGVLTGFIFNLPIHEERSSAASFNDS
jgi:hypothetical protein